MPDEWFIRNVADMPAFAESHSGTYLSFEPPDARFPDTGVDIHVLRPGEPNGMYHRENGQEDFLVLSGECIVIVDDVEHPLRAWDFVHCPGGTDHIFVGAGTGPCAILMIGARRPGADWVHYPVSATAARYGASVTESTDSAETAYAGWDGEFTRARLEWPLP